MGRLGLLGLLLDLPNIIRYWGLPRGCWDCEALGVCRRPKEQGWKCYKGCLIIRMGEMVERERKRQENQEKYTKK